MSLLKLELQNTNYCKLCGYYLKTVTNNISYQETVCEKCNNNYYYFISKVNKESTYEYFSFYYFLNNKRILFKIFNYPEIIICQTTKNNRPEQLFRINQSFKLNDIHDIEKLLEKQIKLLILK